MRRKALSIRIDMSSFIIAGICVACLSLFAAIRFYAFLTVFWHVSVSRSFIIVITALFFYLISISVKNASLFLAPAWSILKPYFCLTSAGCLLFFTVFDGIIIDRPLTASGLTLGPGAAFMSLIGASVLAALFLILSAFTIKRFHIRLHTALKTLKRNDIIFLVLLLIALNLFSYMYIRSSRTIYFGDNAGYWTKSHTLAQMTYAGFIPLIRNIYESILTQDYNNLIVAPWIPLVLLFGQSRWVFIAGIINIALFPLYLLLFLFLKAHCRQPILAAICVIMCFPMLFYTALTGFIDILGLIPALGALLLWVTHHHKPPDVYYRYFAVGCLLALAVLLRRWYAFFAVSFFISALFDCLIFKRTIMPFLVSITTFAFSLLFLFQPFVTGLLLKDYSSLYSAFSFNRSVDVKYTFYYFGLAVISALAFGAMVLLRSSETKSTACFLLLQPLICFAIFTYVQSHGQQHLLLYIPAFMLTAAFIIITVTDKMKKTRLAAATLLALCLLTTVHPLLLKTRPTTITDIKTDAILPSFIYVPPYRNDVDEIMRLVHYLDQAVGAEHKTVGILSSSLLLNIDILLNAENSLNLKHLPDINRAYIVWLPEIDSRDSFPGALFQCDYLLVADPIQVQLGAEQQRCIYLPATQLLDSNGFGKAYMPVGDDFHISQNTVDVRLFKKVREVTPQERRDSLRAYDNRLTT